MPTALLLLAAILVPPVGIVMLWMRRGAGIVKKIFGSLAIAAWGLTALVLFFRPHFELDGSGVRPMLKIRPAEAQYAEVEQNRSRQHLQPVAEVKPAIDLATQPRTDPSAGAAYWTDFRGPKRDGRYDEAGVQMGSGSIQKPVWKQPIGGGYASFVVAHGRAFTIEQRRRQEVVTAYSVAIGRELWATAGTWSSARAWAATGRAPAWHEGKVYALGAAGELQCLDGKPARESDRTMPCATTATSLSCGRAVRRASR